MLQNIVITVLIFLFSGVFSYIFGQTPETGIKPSVIVGDAITVGDKKFVVGAKTGPVDVIITDKTKFLKVSATNPNLSAATPGAITDISVGDKLTVTGVLAADGKSVPARSVYFMTKADIAAKNAKEAEEWRRRGITGKVNAVNAQTNQITVEVRGMTGSSNVVLTPKEKAKFLRYAPDSIRFDEAKPSSLDEVKTGDMIRALGDKSVDGTSFAAEQVIAGAFQTIAGTIKSIDAAKNEVVISNLQTKKDVTVKITETSVMKKYPAEMAERLAGFQAGGAGGGARPVGQGNTGGGQPRPANPDAQGQTPGGGRGGFGGGAGGRGPGGPGGAGGGNIDDMLDRFPNITAADLKVGDMIALSSTKTADVTSIKAIKLLAGVEPFLRAAQAGSGRGRGQNGSGPDFNIPGLDGLSFP